MTVKARQATTRNTLKLFLISELKHEVFPLPEALKEKGINRHRWYKLINNTSRMTAEELLLIANHYQVDPKKIMDI